MAEQPDNFDFVVAFAVGALVGAGVTLLFKQDEETLSQSLMRELKPIRKQVHKSTRSARKSAKRHGRRAAQASAELGESGRDMLSDLRKEAGEILERTRDEMQREIRRRRRKKRRSGLFGS